MLTIEEATNFLRLNGILVDQRINVQLVKDYFYHINDDITDELAFEILDKALEHPYFLSGLIKIMDHVTALQYQNIKLK